MKRVFSIIIRVLFLVLSLSAGNICAGNYDPLAVDPAFQASHVDLTVHDSARNRDIPVRVYLPTNTVPEPVILFSHGLGGTREGSIFLGEHWAVRGYVAVFLQQSGQRRLGVEGQANGTADASDETGIKQIAESK